MVSLAALGAGFAVTALSELGDKTQLAVVSLASRHPRRAVFLGAVTAEVLMTALAVTVGVALWIVAPLEWIQAASAIAFLAVGIYLLWRREAEPADAPKVDEKKVFASTFGLTAVGELGDKTQLATVALAASTGAPGEVFVGACLALTLMMALAVLIGDRLAKRLEPRTLRVVGAALFLVAGLVLVAELLLS